MKYTINSESIYGAFMLAVVGRQEGNPQHVKKSFLSNFKRFSLGDL